MADVNDKVGALEAFRLNASSLSTVQSVLADGGYTGEAFASEVQNILGARVKLQSVMSFTCLQ